MKKILISSCALLLLSSCGTPVFETPEEALLDNQQKVVEKIQKISQMTPKEAHSAGTLDVNIQSDDINVEANLGYNFDVNQQTWDSSGNINLSIDGKTQQDYGVWFQEFSGNTDFDLITLKNKIFFKLNELKISKPEENPSIAMIEELSSPYLQKWFFMEDSLGEIQNANMNMLAFEKEFYEILNTQRLFDHVSTNENENYYDYVVDINSQTIVNIAKEINNLSSVDENNQLTQQDFDFIKQDIDALNQETQINIRIDKNNTQYFIFTLTDENSTLTIENTKDNLNFLLVEGNSDTNIEVIGTKKLTGLESTITAKHADKEILVWTMNISTNGKDTNMNFQAVTKQNEKEINITMNLSDTTTQKDFNVTQPEDAKNFQEVIMEVMGTMMWSTYIWEPSSFEDEYSQDFNEEFNYSEVQYDEESTGIIYE